MKRLSAISGLITAISMLLTVIWLSPVFAAAPVFTTLGEIKVDGLRIPGAMDMDAAGNLFVADTRGGKVHRFDPYGNLEQSFELQATGAGLAVALDGQRLYVSRSQSVVIVSATTGEELGALSGGEVDTTEFAIAGEIDLDAAGNVYVVDAGRLQIKVYNEAGQYQTRFGGVGTTAGLFRSIGGMAVSPAGQVVVADASGVNNMVHVFSVDAGLNVTGVTTYLNTSFGTPALFAPRGLTFDNAGRGYILEFQSSQVRTVSSSFAYLGSYNNPGHAMGQLKSVTDAVFDPTHSRLFVGCDSGRIEILGIDGGQNPVPQVNRAPGMPTTQSPVASSEVNTATPVLTIGNATDEDGDALTYHVVVSQDDVVVFEADVPEQPGATTTVVVDTALAENATFSWTAQASDGQASSDVTPAANFIVNAMDEAPTAPILSAPLDGESIDGPAALVWAESSDPDPSDNVTAYRVEVALDAAFSQLVAEQSLADTSLALESFVTYDDFVDETPYFWRVFAADEDQTLSEPSAVGQFLYDTTGLTITANMPDARVSFHGNHAYTGQILGTTPLELRDLAAGVFSVVVERPGFETFVTQLTIAAQENTSLYVELIPAKVVNSLVSDSKGINDRKGLAVDGMAMPFLVDFDNDGDLDLLVGDNAGQLTLFANLQLLDNQIRVNVDQGAALDLPVMPGAVPFVVDWNNDGRKDLLVGQADGSVTLFANIGLDEAPAFDAGVDLQVAGGALSVGDNAAPAVMDYFGNGLKDLVVGNQAGDVVVFPNQGTDAAPVLAAPVVIAQTGSAVVPMPVDWDADGQSELLLSAADSVFVYAKMDGQFQAIQEFSEKKAKFVSAFPVTLNDAGKQLFCGQAGGEVVLLSGNNFDVVGAFFAAMHDKVDELGSLVAEENPALLADVTAINVNIEAKAFDLVADAADDIASQLAVGAAAQTSALELAAISRSKFSVPE